ncbi:hypothetical protein DSM112329_02988 [Paraconexibacter sp. AEG42_29]
MSTQAATEARGHGSPALSGRQPVFGVTRRLAP